MPPARCLPLRLRAYHVGVSFVSLAPTYFISQSALTPLLLLSKPQPLCWVAVWGRRFAAVLLYTGKISILTVLSTFKRLPVSGKSFLFPVPAVYADQTSPEARLLGKGLGAGNVPPACCLSLRLRAYHSSQEIYRLRRFFVASVMLVVQIQELKIRGSDSGESLSPGLSFRLLGGQPPLRIFH